MEWIIFGLLALLAIVYYIVSIKLWDLQEEICRLKREQKQSADTTSETLKQKVRLIDELNHDLSKLNDRDAALQAKLEAMHMAAIRLCASVKLPGRPGIIVEPLTCGAHWYRNKDNPRYLEREDIEIAARRKPTVDEWIEFANSISADAEANRNQWWKEIEEDRKKEEADRTSFENSCLGLVFKMAYYAQSIYAGEDHKQTRDLMLLEFLDQFQEFITYQRQHNGNAWQSASLWFMTSERGIELSHLRGMLLDLMKHRNAEYMAILNKFPPGVAMEFLRLTVAEPVAATG